MMEMHLHDEPFKLVASGVKTIEARLYDGKRQTFKSGDVLKIYNRATGATIQALIVELMIAPNFSELIAGNEIADFGYNSVDDFLKILSPFYSDEDVRRFGVVGIRLRVID